MKSTKAIEKRYALAREQFAAHGVNTDRVLKRLSRVAVSLHCWQGDDVGGFEQSGGELTGGIMATGNYPGRARTPEELRSDATKALSLLPGRHRFNLHACYGEFRGKRVDRNEIDRTHFRGWIDWARSLGIGLDFNPTCFSHPKSADGFTLSHRSKSVRQFWIEHCQASRNARAVGASTQSTHASAPGAKHACWSTRKSRISRGPPAVNSLTVSDQA